MTSGRSAHTGLRLWLERHKPRGRRRTQLLLALCMWTVVGAFLLAMGVSWILHGFGQLGLLFVALFAALGVPQALFILDRVAGKTVARIQLRGDGRCLGGFLSVRSWLLVAFMVALGQVLRASPLPRAYLGMIYVWIGSALLLASRRYWRALWEGGPSDEPSGTG
jgi:hypothetical protein